MQRSPGRDPGTKGQCSQLPGVEPALPWKTYRPDGCGSGRVYSGGLTYWGLPSLCSSFHSWTSMATPALIVIPGRKGSVVNCLGLSPLCLGRVVVLIVIVLGVSGLASFQGGPVAYVCHPWLDEACRSCLAEDEMEGDRLTQRCRCEFIGHEYLEKRFVS